MIGVRLVREMVESVILTGRVANHEPVSLLLIAAPESGKTSVVCEKECKTVAVFSDITGKGVQTVCKMQPEISHLIINDMVAVMSHKPQVAKFTISQLCAMTEEGIKAVGYPGAIETFEHGKRGVIACLTTALARDGRQWWNRIGFTSRMIPFNYHLSDDLVLTIKEYIDSNSDKKKVKVLQLFQVPEKPLTVKCPKPMTGKIRNLADACANRLGETGFRRLKQYHSLARAHAIWRTHRNPTVTQKDIDFLRTIDRYISYKNGEPIE